VRQGRTAKPKQPVFIKHLGVFRRTFWCDSGAINRCLRLASLIKFNDELGPELGLAGTLREDMWLYSVVIYL